MTQSLSLSSAQFSTKLSTVLPVGSFFAPASIQLALALVAAGATGETLAELQSVLGWPSGPNWQQELGRLFVGLQHAMAASEPIFAVANRIYTKVQVKPEYATAVQSVFNAKIESLISADQINNFVSNTTRGMIKEIVNDDHVRDSLLIAVNALYFKGMWSVPFDIASTKAAPFQTNNGLTSTCQMMQTPVGEEWFYYEDANAQYILLPYCDTTGSDSPLAAIIALPRSTTDNALSNVDWNYLLHSLPRTQKQKGTLWLPRFRIESETIKLKESMKALGVRRTFGMSAEFPLVSDVPIKIDEILHKVVVEVDEKGTVAAAATAVVAKFGCLPPSGPPPFQMRCDRPFAFCLASFHSAPVVLFAGTVTDPGCASTGPVGTWPISAPSPGPISFAAPGPISIPAPVTTPQMSVAQRSEQACLFTPECRRDVYRILCALQGQLENKSQAKPTSASPNTGLFGKRDNSFPKTGPFGTFPALGSPQTSPFGGSIKTPPVAPVSKCAPLQWVLSQPLLSAKKTLVSINYIPEKERKDAVLRTLTALEQVGQPTQAGIEFTEAFEALLVDKFVGWWTDADTATLSVAFILAFGLELTPRLDIEHTIRSRTLSRTEIEWLCQLPECIVFNRSLLGVFQSHV